MASIPDWVQALAVPALGALGRITLAGPTLQRRIKRHLEIYKELPETLRPELDGLLRSELQALAQQEAAKTGRKLNSTAIGSALLLAAFTALCVWGVLAIDLLAVKILLGLVGALLFGAATTLLPQMYEAPEAEERRQAEKRAKGPKGQPATPPG